MDLSTLNLTIQNNHEEKTSINEVHSLFYFAYIILIVLTIKGVTLSFHFAKQMYDYNSVIRKV